MMYNQISHTADLAYEIVFEDLEDLFGDIISIMEENAEFEKSNENKIEVYRIDGGLEDFIFDTVNDMISNVEMGWFPTRVDVKGDELIVEFSRLKSLNKFDIKALTYHMLKVKDLNGKKIVKVVFDV